VASVNRRAAIALDERNGATGALQHESGGDAGDSTADHHDIDGVIALEFVMRWERGRIDPVRSGVEGFHRPMDSAESRWCGRPAE
jgi:hypothetical protein